jgi:hypothetical protein
MDAVRRESDEPVGGPVEEILDLVRSEPAVAFFLAQAVWIAQPALEAFWPRERIEEFAEGLEFPDAARAAEGEGGR